MNTFDQYSVAVYVINLDRSYDRLQQISAQLQDQNLNFIRIPAIDGKHATTDQQAMLDEAQYRRQHGKTSVPGELGATYHT